MSKLILVIDTPDSCRECPLCAEEHMTYRDYCRITDDVIWTLDKPEWCPLLELPEKLSPTGNPYDEYGDGYVDGYNACIDEILGGN